MNRISRLYRLPAHKQAEETAFMLRLCFKKEKDQPSKADCINLFNQYIPLYEAMEKRLRYFAAVHHDLLKGFTEHPWEGRSRLLKQDVADMMKDLPRASLRELNAPDNILLSVSEMVRRINCADPLTLLGFLAVRCLGDAYGGQALEKYRQKIFGENSLGGSFYLSVSGQASSIGKYVQNIPMTEEDEAKFVTAAAGFFRDHVQMFEELETERQSKQQVSGSSLYRNGCRYALYAISAAGVALTAGAVYSQFAFRE